MEFEPIVTAERVYFLRQVRPPFDPSSERLRWLEQFLPFAPPPPEPMTPAEMAPVGSGERDGCD